MSNASFSKISELMVPERAAETRSTGSNAGDRASSGAAVQRFEQLLQTASEQRPHRPATTEARRTPERPKAAERAERQRPTNDRLDRPERPRSERREDSSRTDDRDRPGRDAEGVSNDRRDGHDRADQVDAEDDRDIDDQTADEQPDSDDGETTDDELAVAVEDETGPEAEVETNDADGDEAVVNTLGDGAAELVTDDADGSPEETMSDEQPMVDGSTNDGPAVEAEVVETIEDIEVDTVVEAETDGEGETLVATDVDEQDAEGTDTDTAAASNAAAVQAAAAPVTTEPSAEVVEENVEGDVAVEEVQTGTAGGLDADVDPELALQLQDDGSADGETEESSEIDSADDAEADPSNLDGEAQPDQQQADGGDAETAPLALPVQANAAQGTPQAATTNPVAGLAEVSGTVELGSAASRQVAGAAPAEQADGADPLWRQVRRAMGSIRNLPTGEQQLTIRLRPDDLGSVTIRISTGEAGTTVALVADSSAAASQLNQQRQQLIRELEDGGLRGVAVDVGTSGDAEPNGGDPESEVDEGGRAVVGTNVGGNSSDDDPARVYRGRSNGRATEGLIDVDL